MKKILLSLILLVGLPLGAFAQTPPDNDEVVIVTTNLIQIDATVTRRNKQVTDLKIEDFEIFENGEKQVITNFSYIAVTPPNAPETKPKNAAINAAAAPPVVTRLKAEQVRRTIALVVDDLGLSFESVARVRGALKKFVDEQMQPNDLIAIVRTSGGIGALQQFTSDKRQLYAAIEKVRFNALGRGGVSTFPPIQATAQQIADNITQNTNPPDANLTLSSDAEINRLRQDLFSVGTLGAVNFIVQGMKELPGRKAVTLFSDGFQIQSRDEDGNIDAGQSRRVLEALNSLTEQANRASVVINTIDPRGLVYTGITAADDTAGLSRDQLQQQLTSRSNELFDTQDGLKYLAQQTGGRSFINGNDIKGAVEKVLDDQQGYYLLAYQPDGDSFEKNKRRFNKLEVRVKNPGLKVRYRSGFFGVGDDETATLPNAKQTPSQQIRTALISPFGASGIGLRLNSLFGNDARNDSFIRSFVYIPIKDLTFTDEPDKTKKAVFDLVAYTFGDNGVPVDQISKTFTFRVKPDELTKMQGEGLIYEIGLPVKKPGAYQLRMAVRDAGSEKLGSANQFIEIPNLKKNNLKLSGLILQSMTYAQYQKAAANSFSTEEAKKLETDLNPSSDTAIRRFKRGKVLQFGYSVYNAKLTNGQPQLKAQTRLFRDGKMVFEGKPAALDATGQTDLTRIAAWSAILLAEKLEAGDYTLQIVVTDMLAKEKNRITSQFVEFEIVN